jgi:hypothetical protein
MEMISTSAVIIEIKCQVDAILILASRWSNTGDRYLVKLFKDYVFHT